MNWIETYTGKKFNLLDPQPDQICLEDIAHSLSMMCRFGGHTRRFYSVAEHSVRVCMASPDEIKMEALFHDSAEAYLSDLSSPLKNCLGNHSSKFHQMEMRILEVIYKKYSLDFSRFDEVKYYDQLLLSTEVRDLMHNVDRWADSLPKPELDNIIPWSQPMAKMLFSDMAVNGIKEIE